MILQKFAISTLCFLILITASGCKDLTDPISNPVPSEYEEYRYISRGDINSGRYRVIKTAYSVSSDEIYSAYYDPISKQYLVNVNNSDGSGADTILKINNRGKIVDKLESPAKDLNKKYTPNKRYASGFINGILLFEDVYFDWFSETAKEQHSTVNMDLLSVEEFSELYDTAIVVNYQQSHKSKVVVAYMLINDKQYRLESAELYQPAGSDEERGRGGSDLVQLFDIVYDCEFPCESKFDSKRFPKKTVGEFIAFSEIEDYYDPAFPNFASIDHQYKSKKKYHKKYISFNPNSTGGSAYWTGIDYFELRLDGHTINFKTYNSWMSAFELKDSNGTPHALIHILDKSQEIPSYVEAGVPKQDGIYLITENQ